MALPNSKDKLANIKNLIDNLQSAPQSADGIVFGNSEASGNYSVTGEWLENMATKIQSLTGASGGLTTEQMDTELDTAITEVDKQSNIISETSEILSTKTGSNGGSSGSGIAVETCTFVVEPADAPIMSGQVFCHATSADLTYLKMDMSTPATYNVLKNSIIYSDSGMVSWSGTFTKLDDNHIIISDDSSICFMG